MAYPKTIEHNSSRQVPMRTYLEESDSRKREYGIEQRTRAEYKILCTETLDASAKVVYPLQWQVDAYIQC